MAATVTMRPGRALRALPPAELRSLALLEVRRVQPEIGPVAHKRPIQEGTHPLVDVLAQLGDRALADAAQPHGLHQVVHTPGGHAADPGLLDHRHQGFLRRLARLQERREVAALPQLGNAQLQAAEPGVQRPVAIAVAIGRALAGTLVATGTDQSLHVGLHQQLHHGLGHGTQEIAVSGFGQKLGQWQCVLGHRVLSVGDEASQLHPSQTIR